MLAYHWSGESEPERVNGHELSHNICLMDMVKAVIVDALIFLAFSGTSRSYVCDAIFGWTWIFIDFGFENVIASIVALMAGMLY